MPRKEPAKTPPAPPKASRKRARPFTLKIYDGDKAFLLLGAHQRRISSLAAYMISGAIRLAEHDLHQQHDPLKREEYEKRLRELREMFPQSQLLS